MINVLNVGKGVTKQASQILLTRSKLVYPLRRTVKIRINSLKKIPSIWFNNSLFKNLKYSKATENMQRYSTKSLTETI